MSSEKVLKETLVLTLLGVLLFVVQVALAVIPNFELVTTLLIIYVYKFGAKALIPTYIFAVAEILVYGFGIWNVMYLYVWALLVLVALPLRKINSPIFHAVFAAFFGLLFGTLCSIPYFVTGGISFGISWIVSGIPFDFIHCGANFLLTFILYSPLVKAMEKIKI